MAFLHSNLASSKRSSKVVRSKAVSQTDDMPTCHRLQSKPFKRRVYDPAVIVQSRARWAY